MSQLILDDQLDVHKVLPGLKRWTTVTRLQALRPGEHIFDDRVPEILLTCREPTFITIDADFWKRTLCHSRYCIVYVEIDFRRQEVLPGLLRKLFRHAQFKTQAQRMGKVIRLGESGVWFWELGSQALKHVSLTIARRSRRQSG